MGNQLTPIYVRDRNYRHFKLDGTVVDSVSVGTGDVAHLSRYAEVSYQPVYYYLTPGVDVPSKSKAFVVTVYTRMDRGYHHHYATRFASFAAAFKRLQQIGNETR